MLKNIMENPTNLKKGEEDEGDEMEGVSFPVCFWDHGSVRVWGPAGGVRLIQHPVERNLWNAVD